MAFAHTRRLADAHRALEWVAVIAAPLLVVELARRVGLGVGGARDALLLGAALLASSAAADLVSGVVHWWADRLGDESSPWLGARLIRPFREHHGDPKAIAEHDFVETNGNTCLVAAPFLAALLLLPAPRADDELFAAAFALGLLAWLALTNQIHKWAHAPQVPRGVRWLQQARLILRPHDHAAHHAASFDRCYCITTGWLNPLLDRSRLFAGVETALGLGDGD